MEDPRRWIDRNPTPITRQHTAWGCGFTFFRVGMSDFGGKVGVGVGLSYVSLDAKVRFREWGVAEAIPATGSKAIQQRGGAARKDWPLAVGHCKLALRRCALARRNMRSAGSAS